MNPSVQELRLVNEQLSGFLDHLGGVSNQQQLLDSSHITDLLNTVLQAGEYLQAATTNVADPEWQRERDAYRANLERLRGLLPLLEIRLRMERARLESERSQLQAASEWITSSRQTF